uniref:Ion transport domain-containing protein n=1 Tax=Leersia perrieri TaxID=77586 RepID=A0A0D9VM05_9ORYZ
MFGPKKVDDEMALKRQKTVRFYDDKAKPTIPTHQKQAGFAASKLGVASSGKNKIFVPGDELWYNKILDPSSDFILTWNRVFLFSCFVALFIDPLYFYVPKIVYGNPNSCIGTDRHLAITVTFFRSISDLLYFIHIMIKFRTAYINPSSTLRVFGRGDLITDPKEIAWQYFRSDFVVDAVAALPLPQILVWFVIPAIKYSTAEHNNNILVLIVLAQYFPRLYLIFPLTYEIVKTTGVVAKTAWQGAAYNMLLYMIASHVLGALWYLLSVDRQTACWKSNCKNETGCNIKFLDCDVIPNQTWASITAVFNNCDATVDSPIFDYGMFQPALSNQAPGQGFLMKYFYSLWWGLQNLSCYGQTITVSTYIGETLYCIFLAVLGLVLFAHLIGNVQTYLQSITVRVEEWRLKQRDTEEWMRHRQLPNELQERVRRFIQYKWLATRGVNEESILQALPADLRRDIKRHLCLGLVRRVNTFASFYKGQPSFFNSTTLKSGDFCGEELLGWALVPKPTVNLPSSTRTVKALIEVEAFALQAEDLKFVASQFRRLHSKRLQHTFRYYSHHWRTWASCFIQAAWRRYKRRKMAWDLSMRESFYSMRSDDSSGEDDPRPKQNLALKIMSGSRKGPQNMKELPKIRKPDEPDFSAETYE